MRKICVILSLVFLFILFCQQSSAQDTHYWTYAYGTRAVLLGGTVIGSVLDISGIYYNPGGLSLLEDPETLLASKVYHWPRYSFGNIGKTDREITSAKFDNAPGIVAGLIKFPWLKDHRIGYSVITRQKVDIRLNGTVITSGDAIPDYPGEESIIGSFHLIEDLSEPWWGLTWAYKFNDTIGVGISNYFTFRSHRASYQGSGQVLTSEGDLAMIVDAISYDYQNYRLLWKMGLALDFDSIHLGFTLTTPSIELYGKGSANLNRTITGWDLDDDGVNDNVLTADYQDGVDSNFPTPIALGVGTKITLSSKEIGTLNFYASAEWYAGIDKFDVVKTEEFVGQSDGETYRNEITHELDDVLNFGLGIEHIFNKNITLYGSIRTDFSARKQGSDTTLSVTDWDIYHIMAGTTFRIKNTEWTLGLGYSWGGSKKERSPSIDDPYEQYKISQLFQDVRFNYDSISVLFGFSF
jgi:hypothetical protein